MTHDDFTIHPSDPLHDKNKTRSLILGILGVVGLLGVIVLSGLYAYDPQYFSFGPRPEEARPTGAAPAPKDAEQTATPTNGHLALINIRQYTIENTQDGLIVVIDGQIRNDGDRPKQLIQLEAKLFDEAGAVLYDKTFYAGTFLDINDLTDKPLDEIEAALTDPVRIAKNDILPGDELKFMAVFAAVDLDTMAEYGLEILGAKDVPLVNATAKTLPTARQLPAGTNQTNQTTATATPDRTTEAATANATPTEAPPGAQPWFPEDSLDSFSFEDMRQYVVKNRHKGDICVIDGKVKNEAHIPRSRVRLEAILMNKKGQVVRSKKFFAGPVLTLWALENEPPTELEKALVAPDIITLSNSYLAPEGTVGFMVIFEGVRGDIAEYAVKVIEVKDLLPENNLGDMAEKNPGPHETAGHANYMSLYL